MRTITFLLMAMAGSVAAQQPPYEVFPDAKPPYYRVRYEASTNPGELSYPVNYTIWIPPRVEAVRGVIVHQHGCGEGSCRSGLTGAFDLHWQALARQHDCALMAPSYEQPENGECSLWCDPRNGSDATFHRALSELGAASGHAELADVPWALWGHSGGGTWAGTMTLLHPERVVAAWLRSGGPSVTPRPDQSLAKPVEISDEALAVPIMLNLGTKEGVTVKEGRFARVWPRLETVFKTMRGQGGLVGVAVDPLTSHECGNQRYLAIRWLDACLSARLPDRVGEPLKRMPADKAWLAPLLGTKAVPEDEFTGDKRQSAWLPNKGIATAWMEYVRDTQVSDATPPPAPTNVQVNNGELTWDAEADLESGLKHFVVERDGEEIATVPGNPINRFGRPIFQGLQYSDTPEQPLVEMRFTDESAQPGQSHTYRVVAVNTVGLRSTAERAGISLDESLRHSDIALMPEGTTGPPTSMSPLRPTVVAWGYDALSLLDRPDALRQRMEAYRQIGIRLLACNVWMLTATDRVLHDQPEYQEAVCVDIAGTPIVPPWLDSEYRGVRPYWGCTNHPLFRQQVIRRAKAGIAAGANLLHLDDHRGTAAAARFAGGCFCDHCMLKFRDWLKQEYSADQRTERGIENLETFDYRQLVRSAGYKTLESYQQGVYSNRIPLREEFLAFQRQAAARFVAELGKTASAVAGREVPVGINAFNLSPSQLSNAHVADYFANEVEHYGVEETVPPLVYKLASALGKPVFATGAGHDWIHIGEDQSVTRVRRWIATAYSFGHYFMYAQRKWGFSKETGTRWYLTPISTYLPLTRFVAEHPQLFDDHHAVAQVGLLYSNRACHQNHWEVREVARQLHDASVPFSLVVAGDDRLEFALNERQLSSFPVTIVPQPTLLEGEPARLLEHWTAEGRAIPWRGLDDLRRRIRPWISVRNATGIWALPRARKQPASLVIHLLNQNYDAENDEMREGKDVQLAIHRELLPSTGPLQASWYAHDVDTTSLQIEADADLVHLRVPRVALWAVVHVQPQ